MVDTRASEAPVPAAADQASGFVAVGHHSVAAVVTSLDSSDEATARDFQAEPWALDQAVAAAQVGLAVAGQCLDYVVENGRAPWWGFGMVALHSGWVRPSVEASRSSWDAVVPASSQIAFADPAVAVEDPQDREPHLAEAVVVEAVVGLRGAYPSQQNSSESEASPLVGAAAAAAEVVGHPYPGSCRRQRHWSLGH